MDPNEVLKKLEAAAASRQGGAVGTAPDGGINPADVLKKFDQARGYSGPTRGPDSRLQVAPGTTQEQAARIPQGMAYDKKTGGYVDTANMATRALIRDPQLGQDGNLAAGIPFVGEYFDEAVGKLNNLVTGRGEDVGAEFTREVQKQYADENPKTALANRVTGGFVGAAGVAGAFKQVAKAAPAFATWALSFMPKSLTYQVLSGGAVGAVAGAVEGAVSGYGAGNDGNRQQKAGQYAGTGAIGGAVGGAAAPLIAKAAPWVYNALKNNFGRVSAKIPGLSSEASRTVLDAANADAAFGSPIANIRRAGPNGMVADFGESTQELLDSAVNMSSTGRVVAGRAVQQRSAASVGNLNTTFDDIMGGPQGGIALRKAVDDAAKPGIRDAYKDAYGTIIDYSKAEGRRIESIIMRMPKRILDAARSKATARMDWEGIPYQYLADVAQDGTVRVSRIPSVVELDYLKRGLDDVISDGTDPLTRKLSSDAQLAQSMKVALRDALKDAVPSYGRALNEASDAFSLNEAIDLGERLLKPNVTREQAEIWARGATDIERKAMVAGLRSHIDETIANVKVAASTSEEVAQSRKILRELSSSAARAKILTALGPQDARRVFRALDEATQSLQVSGSVSKNSLTAPRLKREQAIKDVQSYSTAQIARDAASGHIFKAPTKVAEIAANNTPAAQAARVEEMYLEIAQYLTGKRGPDAVREAEALIATMNRAPAQAQNARSIGLAAGSSAPALGYLSATQSQRTGAR